MTGTELHHLLMVFFSELIIDITGFTSILSNFKDIQKKNHETVKYGPGIKPDNFMDPKWMFLIWIKEICWNQNILGFNSPDNSSSKPMLQAWVCASHAKAIYHHSKITTMALAKV